MDIYIFELFSYAVLFQITDCMLRTIRNVVDVTADVNKTPYLEIDVLYEETGIEVVPRVPEINGIYHNVIDDVSINIFLSLFGFTWR